MLKHGADPTKKNRDGATPLDLVREGDEDVADLLRGKGALLDAAKKGNLARVQRLVTPENINSRDSQGRNSTLLHLAGNFFIAIIYKRRTCSNICISNFFLAGYNNFEVAGKLLFIFQPFLTLLVNKR